MARPMIDEPTEVLFAELLIVTHEEDELMPAEIQCLVGRDRLRTHRAEVKEPLGVMEELPGIFATDAELFLETRD